MSSEFQTFLGLLADRKDLTQDQAAHAFQIIMNGAATPAQIAAFLVALRMKGETATEITGGALALRQKMLPFSAPADAVDTCGTGGDVKGTLNISTAVSLVVAACGVPVVKHGNRAVSSASGSADVLRALGVNVQVPAAVMEQMLREHGFAFLLAPLYHPAMRHVAPVRAELGLRSIFNLLGPLANPARPGRQLIGVFSQQWVEPMAQVLQTLGLKRAWVVHGSDGLDELTLSGPSYVCETSQGQTQHFTLHPEDAGLPTAPLDELRGQDAEYNARALNELLIGGVGAYRNSVLYNAAAMLVISEKVTSLQEGVAMAAQAIDSGKARHILTQLVEVTTHAAA